MTEEDDIINFEPEPELDDEGPTYSPGSPPDEEGPTDEESDGEEPSDPLTEIIQMEDLDDATISQHRKGYVKYINEIPKNESGKTAYKDLGNSF